MRRFAFTSTSALLLLLLGAVPSQAATRHPQDKQDQHAPAEKKDAKPAAKKPAAKPATAARRGPEAKPEANRAPAAHPAAERRPAPEAHRAPAARPALRLSPRSHARIPDDRFRASFGRAHAFRIGRPIMVGGFSRFRYGGYSFGFVEPWPPAWSYNDNVYVDFVGGGYYLFDPVHPGVRIAISVIL